MNIHPAFVHFPIALLCVYAVLEIIPFARFWPALQWEAVRRFSLYAGSAFGVLTYITGLMAEDVVGELPSVGAHEQAAVVTLIIFAALCAMDFFWKGESALKYWLTKALALAGFVMLFVVGALGANIVYGPDVDPIVTFVTKLFGL